MDIEFNCDCGNPNCKAWMHFRKGYVHIGHPDGSQEERWDYFYINAHNWSEGTKEKTSSWIELMLPPEAARDLWWFLLWEFIPGFRHLSWVYRAYFLRWYWSARWWVEDRFNRNDA